MRRLRQGVIAAVFGAMTLGSWAANSGEKHFEYQPPRVEPSRFDEQLGMLDRERGEYATHLATYAANMVSERRASAASLQEARRLLAVALHLSPRNRKALVVNSQLRRGILPEPTESDYSAGVLARLLLTRAELLLREGGAQNELLARSFVELAAGMDPHNEDAIYVAELQRLDHGEFDWKLLTDVAPPAPPADEEPPASPPVAGNSER